MGTSSDEYSEGVALDADGNIFITGWTWGDLDGQTNAGEDDAFLSKYDTSGSLLWTRLLGTTSYDVGRGGVAADADGNIFISGTTGGDLDGQTNAGGPYDAFVAKFVVPEPATLALLLLGRLALLRRHRI